MKNILSRVWSGVDRLGVRLAIVLAVALLPLMIISIVRSQSVVSEAVARSQGALVGETLRAVQEEVIIIERAKALAQALSRSVPIMLDDPELCTRLMHDKLNDTAFSFAGFYDTTSYVPCSTADEPFSFGMTVDLAEQLADPKPIVLINEQAPISGESVIYASHPVFDTDGSLMGFTAISVPHKRLRTWVWDEPDAVFLTLNSQGKVLTSPGSLEDAELILPQLEPGQDITKQPVSFSTVGRDGIERLYALVPVVKGELYALSSWPMDREVQGDFYLKNPALFPALMWLASLVVAWFAASLFVTRHVIKLKRSMQGFAETRTVTTHNQFAAAPKELREVADAFIGMTDTIMHDEAQIEDTLRQKDVLLREVHHRVKNNLQLIASIMSMQMRQSRSKEVRQLMQSLHDRVNSLATIHRNLYQTSGQADISMDEHLDAIVHQVVRMAASRDKSIDLKTDFASIRLNPDQAVPLSLFVTEAMTNALKYIGSVKGSSPSLSVSLVSLPDDYAQVTVTNSVTPNAAAPDAEKSSGLGSELMEAFSEQLEGEFEVNLDNNQFTVHLTFPVEALTAKS
ncbi:sensor histidine kinase [Pacificibacter marinus]|uniref:histidine kinase n=1 Tax=Pacificibacter marinus TaxID=658057 RepID=A0A1Y5RK82_9RHOB|nr:sensor histidine kinase [Pacificibacter marinus]SEK20314.1 Two-component sensor histidine kinase, contains HisKA and HATPase domains [Pacificibacter marinus]SLN16772.1 putative sensor histidine kinase pdtaS [Pacificibacter marinus]